MSKVSRVAQTQLSYNLQRKITRKSAGREQTTVEKVDVEATRQREQMLREVKGVGRYLSRKA